MPWNPPSKLASLPCPAPRLLGKTTSRSRAKQGFLYHVLNQMRTIRQAVSAVFNLSLLHNLFMLKYWFSFHSLRRGPKSVKSWWRVARTCCFCMDLTLPSHPRGTIGHRVHKFTNCLSAIMFGNARQESKNGEMEAGSTSQISGKCFRHKRTCQSPHWACWRQSALSHCSGST